MAEPTDEQYRQAIVEIGDLVDSIDSLTINVRKEQLAVLLQGLAFYVHDTARAALILIDQDARASAAALTRIAVEHATMAQWIAIQPNGASKYLDELAAQAKTFGAKAEGIGNLSPRRHSGGVSEVRRSKACGGNPAVGKDVRGTRPKWLDVHAVEVAVRLRAPVVDHDDYVCPRATERRPRLDPHGRRAPGTRPVVLAGYELGARHCAPP